MLDKQVFFVVFYTILERSYKKHLKIEELNERAKFMTDNIDVILPENLFKSIIYCDTENEIGKLAVDFRLKFISSEYKEAITSGTSYEIDNLVGVFGDELRAEIKLLCIAVNHWMLKFYLSGETKHIKEHINELEATIQLKIRETIPPTWEVFDGVISRFSPNQRCYMAVYGVDIGNGRAFPEINRNIIKTNEYSRCKLFDLLKEKYKDGISLTYVKDKAFFG